MYDTTWQELLVELSAPVCWDKKGYGSNGALKPKSKELMALAISIVVHCEGCIAYHVHDAVAAGATRQELLETVADPLLMGGGPASMYAAQTMDAIEQFLPEAVSK